MSSSHRHYPSLRFSLRLIAVIAGLILLSSSPAKATDVWCPWTGERWNDVRSLEELLEIGATVLCNGGGIRKGSRITDDQRQVVNTVIVSALVISRGANSRRVG